MCRACLRTIGPADDSLFCHFYDATGYAVGFNRTVPNFVEYYDLLAEPWQLHVWHCLVTCDAAVFLIKGSASCLRVHRFLSLSQCRSWSWTLNVLQNGASQLSPAAMAGLRARLAALMTCAGAAECEAASTSPEPALKTDDQHHRLRGIF